MFRALLVLLVLCAAGVGCRRQKPAEAAATPASNPNQDDAKKTEPAPPDPNASSPVPKSDPATLIGVPPTTTGGDSKPDTPSGASSPDQAGASTKLTGEEQEKLADQARRRKFLERLKELFSPVEDELGRTGEDAAVVLRRNEELMLAVENLSQFQLDLKPEMEVKLLSLAKEIANATTEGSFCRTEKSHDLLVRMENEITQDVNAGRPTSKPGRRFLGTLLIEHPSFEKFGDLKRRPKMQGGGFDGFETRLVRMRLTGSDLVILAHHLHLLADEIRERRLVDAKIRKAIELLPESEKESRLERSFWKGKDKYAACLEQLMDTPLSVPAEVKDEAAVEAYWKANFPAFKASLEKKFLEAEAKRKHELEAAFVETYDRPAFESLVSLDDLMTQLREFFAGFFPKVKFRPRSLVKRTSTGQPVSDVLPPIALGYKPEDRVPDLQIVTPPTGGTRLLKFVYKNGDQFVQTGNGTVTRVLDEKPKDAKDEKPNPFRRP